MILYYVNGFVIRSAG